MDAPRFGIPQTGFFHGLRLWLHLLVCGHREGVVIWPGYGKRRFCWECIGGSWNAVMQHRPQYRSEAEVMQQTFVSRAP